MAIIHTDSFAWSTGVSVFSDYVLSKGYLPTPNPPQITNRAAAGSIPGPPWPGAWYMEFVQFEWALPTPLSRVITGCRVAGVDNEPELHVAVAGGDGFTITDDGAQHVQLHLGGGVGPVLATGTHTCFDGHWHYLEVDWSVGSTIVVRVDEVVDISVANSVTGLITQFGGSEGFNAFFLADLIIIDPAASPVTAFLGDRHIEMRLPNAIGSSNLWTPNGAGANYTKVADTPNPDYDTTFVSTKVVGDRDYYGLPNIVEAAPAAIDAVAAYIILEKDNTPPRGVKASVYSGGSHFDGQEVLALDGVYSGARAIAHVDPATGLAWTAGGANAAQVGQLISS